MRDLHDLDIRGRLATFIEKLDPGSCWIDFIREEIVLARLRIGHTRITHSHLLKREDEPKCIGCDTPFTVKHFLLECTDFAAERISCFQANNLKELFKDVPVGKILSFLRQVNLFYKKI